MLRAALALFVALFLSACSTLQQPTVVSDPQIVRVPGATRYVAVDPSLTEPTPEPEPPVPLCVDLAGFAVVCDTQLALWIEAWRAALQDANADKAAIRALPEMPNGG